MHLRDPLIDEYDPEDMVWKRIYRFPNGYGALFQKGPGVSGSEGDGWSFVAIEFRHPDPSRHQLAQKLPNFPNPKGVLANVPDDDINFVLKYIEALPPNPELRLLN